MFHVEKKLILYEVQSLKHPHVYPNMGPQKGLAEHVPFLSLQNSGNVTYGYHNFLRRLFRIHSFTPTKCEFKGSKTNIFLVCLFSLCLAPVMMCFYVPNIVLNHFYVTILQTSLELRLVSKPLKFKYVNELLS